MNPRLRQALAVVFFAALGLCLYLAYEALLVFRAFFTWGNFLLWGHPVYLLALGALVVGLALCALPRGEPVLRLRRGWRTYELPAGAILGRDRKRCTVRFRDPAVSAAHARVDLLPDDTTDEAHPARGRWVIEDLASTNGTRLNGAALVPDQPRALAAGDRVALSDATELAVGEPDVRCFRPGLFVAYAAFHVYLAFGFLLGFAALLTGLDEVAPRFRDVTVDLAPFVSLPVFAGLIAAWTAAVNAFLAALRRLGATAALLGLALAAILTTGLQHLYYLLPLVSLHYGRIYAGGDWPASVQGYLRDYLVKYRAFPRQFGFAVALLLAAALLALLLRRWRERRPVRRPLGDAAARRLVYGCAAAAVAVTLATAFFGGTGGRELVVDAGVAMPRLFLPLGPLSVQSVDLVKVLLVVFLAGYFHLHVTLLADAGRRRYWAPLLALSALVVAVVVFQRDLGGATILLFLLLFFYFVVFNTPGRLAAILAGFAALVGLLYVLAPGPLGIVRTRLDGWMDPFAHSEQVALAIWAASSGGLWGKGIGDSQAALIPDVHTDLAFVPVVETGGLLAGLALLALYVIVYCLLARMARHTGNLFWRFFILGTAILFAVQTLYIVGGSTGLLPLTGITLPFVSQGGTSLVVSLALVIAAVGGWAAGGAASVRHYPEILRRTSRNLRLFTRVVLAGTAVTAAWLIWLTGPGAAGFQERRIRDTRRLAAVHRLVADGVYRPTPGGDVAFDARRWAARPDPPFPEAAARRYAALMHARDGRVVVDDIYFSRPSPFRESVRRPRGPILDAHGRPLAYSVGRRRRIYPLGPAAFHPVGYRDAVFGTAGLEQALDPQLAGRSLSLAEWVTAFKHNALSGIQVRTTLLAPLQADLARELAGRRGAAVVLDIRTGGVLALVSAPALDPGQLGRTFSAAAGRPDQPFLDRTVGELYFPGSVFKLVVAAAALQDPAADVNAPWRCAGPNAYRIRCPADHGPVALRPALAVSCNTYFSGLAVRLGDRLVAAADAAGFNRRFLPPLAPGAPAPLPSVAFRDDPDGAPFPLAANPRLVAQCGIGQNRVRLTPLHAAVLATAAANRGEVRLPRLAGELQVAAPDGAVILRRPFPESETVRLFPDLVAAQLAEMMRDVFDTPRGTAYRLGAGRPATAGSGGAGADTETLALAGKTGTAQVAGRAPHAWMVLFAPADAPRVAVAVLVENAGHGSQAAGPIAVRAATTALALLKEDE